MKERVAWWGETEVHRVFQSASRQETVRVIPAMEHPRSSCVEYILGTDIKGIRASVKRAIAQRGFHYQRAVIVASVVSRMEKDTKRNED